MSKWFVITLIDVTNSMKSILKRFLKPSAYAAAPHNRGLSSQPIAQWKRNIFAACAGLALGVYLGQYFPDVFYEQIESHIP